MAAETFGVLPTSVIVGRTNGSSKFRVALQLASFDEDADVAVDRGHGQADGFGDLANGRRSVVPAFFAEADEREDLLPGGLAALLRLHHQPTIFVMPDTSSNVVSCRV